MQKVISDFSRNRLFAAFMALALVVLVGVPFTLATQTSTASNTTLSTDVTEPFTKGMSVSYVDPETGVSESANSNSFRIPAMVTLADGTMVAAADIRWNTTYDGGGLDTLAAYSSNGGASWSYTTANYLGDNGNVYNGSSSSCFIDPCLTVAKDGQTVYMLVDLYPYGVALNGTDKVNPVAATGFDSNGNLLLSDDDHSTYGYYLSGGTIYTTAGEVVEGYTVDSYFNIIGTDGTDSNLFFEDSPYQVTRTGFLYLTKSTDGGASWSAPQLLNVGRESSSEWVTLVAPGSGLTTSEGVMIFPVYSFYGDNDPSGNTQRMSFIYSSDGVNWTRSATRSVSSANWASESAVVELSDGTLRFFFRNGSTNLCYVDYTFSGGWGTYVNTGLDTNSNCQISAITHSQTIDGKQVILVSCPTGPSETGSNLSSASARLNGKIFAFAVESDNTLTKISETSVTSGDAPFMYSCLAERADGSVAILYENKENAWGTGDNCYYTMDMKAYATSDLGLTFDEEGEGDESGGETGSVVVTDEGTDVSATVDSPILTGLLVGKAAVSDGRFAEGKVLAYDVKPTKEGGLYTEAATVTIPIPDGWTEDRVRAFIVESDGSVNLISGEITELGYSYRAPHFSVTGIGETAADVVLQVGESSSVTINDAYYTAEQVSLSPSSVASVSVESQEAVKAVYELAEVTCNGLISGNSQSRTKTNYYYKQGENYYPLYAKRSSSGRLYTSYTYTWGYSMTDSATNVTPIDNDGTQQTYNTSTTPSIDVYTVTEADAQDAYTKLTFIGLLPGETTVTVGEGANTYTVLVTAKSASKNVSLKTGATAELNPLDDLGFGSNSGYDVAYSLEGGESTVSVSDDGVVTAGSSEGAAKVVATVASGGVAVGTVEYAITVADVVVTDVESIYVPVGKTATIEGLSGDIYKGLQDESIATVTPASGTLSNDDLVIAGVAEGMTTVVIGTTQIDVYVVPADNVSNNTSRYLYINVATMENCTVYYAINGGMLYEVKGTGVLIDQTYLGGFNIMFFAKPDEGYALTEMSATSSTTANGTQKTMTDFYVLSNGELLDGSDSDAWPFVDPNASTVPSSGGDSAWKVVNNNKHGFRWSLLEGNMDIDGMRDLFTRALALKCDGATTITKNANESFYGYFTFRAEKLPTLEKTIVSYTRGGEVFPYSSDTTLELGDVVTYRFTVTSTSANVTYSNIVLADPLLDYSKSLSAPSGNYEATYTIKESDVAKYQGNSIVNTATLNYSYKSSYSSGTYKSSSQASVTAHINGLVSYVWASDVPMEIAGDGENYPLPTSHFQTYNTPFYVANTSYDTYVGSKDGIEGVWTFAGWTYGGTTYQGGDTVTMPGSGSVTFVGNWTFTPSLASLTIKKSVTDNDVDDGDSFLFDVDDGDSFLFKVTDASGALVAEVVLTGEDVKAGEGVTVEGLQIGASYTVAEDTDWSWRYDATQPSSGTQEVTIGEGDNKVSFTNNKTKDKWLDFSGWCENLFDGTGEVAGIGYELDK